MATKTPLTIVVMPPVDTWQTEINELRKAGHTVVTLATMEPVPDLFLGPRCWRMDDDHRKYLPLAVKSTQTKRKSK